jgi:hypothetical protein
MPQQLIETHRTTKTDTSALHLWHLLSLDAPTVATLWTWFIAASIHLRLGWIPLLSMASAVWLLYVADRLLDVRQLANDPLQRTGLEPRHLFHHRHRTPFLIGVALVSISLATILPRIPAEAMRLYLILGALVLGYFILIHASGSAAATQGLAHRLPKEIAVGLFFSAATFIPTVARRPDLRLNLLPPAILLAALCSLNCLFIYSWEHPSPSHHSESESEAPHPITRVTLTWLPHLTAALAITAIAIAEFDHHTPAALATACTLSALCLLILHNYRNTISRTTLRAAADLALLTPLLLLGRLR